VKKIKSLFTIINIICSIIASAQEKDIKVTMTDGSIVEGKIEELNYLNYTQKSSFIIKNSTKTNVDLVDITLIEIQDKGRYETHLIDGKKGLFYVKLDGIIKLLYQSDNIYTISGDKLKQLTKEVGSENYFKKNLALLVDENPEFTKYLPDTEFKKSSIESFISNYNKNNSDGRDIIYSTTSGINSKLLIGYIKRLDSTFDTAPISDSGINFNSNTFTIETSLSNHDYINNLSLTTGLWYTIESYDLEGFRNERQVIESSTITTGSGETISQMDTINIIDIVESGSFKANSIQLPVYLEFLNSKKIISYYGAFGFALNRSSINRKFEISEDIEEVKWSGKLLMEAGIAIIPIDNIRINVSYNIDTQINLRARVLF